MILEKQTSVKKATWKKFKRFNSSLRDAVLCSVFSRTYPGSCVSTLVRLPKNKPFCF